MKAAVAGGFNKDLNQEVDLEKTRNRRLIKNKTNPIISIGSASVEAENNDANVEAVAEAVKKA